MKNHFLILKIVLSVSLIVLSIAAPVHCGWGTAASAHPTASEARCCLDCGRRPTPASHPAAPEARNRPDRGRSSTAAADPTVTKALGGVIRAEGKRALT